MSFNVAGALCKFLDLLEAKSVDEIQSTYILALMDQLY